MTNQEYRNIIANWLKTIRAIKNRKFHVEDISCPQIDYMQEHERDCWIAIKLLGTIIIFWVIAYIGWYIITLPGSFGW
jgi:hypothetical protein